MGWGGELAVTEAASGGVGNLYPKGTSPQGNGLCVGHNNSALIVFWQRDNR